jgi:hypothetical protein
MRQTDSILVEAWDRYVNSHIRATLYHLSPWRGVISKTYAHRSYYLLALRSSTGSVQCITLPKSASDANRCCEANIGTKPDLEPVGILPLVHLKHFLFGSNLISLPFFDMGGILADNEEIERALLSKAVRIGQDLKADHLELRHVTPLSWLQTTGNTSNLKASWLSKPCLTR